VGQAPGVFSRPSRMLIMFDAGTRRGLFDSASDANCHRYSQQSIGREKSESTAICAVAPDRFVVGSNLAHDQSISFGRNNRQEEDLAAGMAAAAQFGHTVSAICIVRRAIRALSYCRTVLAPAGRMASPGPLERGKV